MICDPSHNWRCFCSLHKKLGTIVNSSCITTSTFCCSDDPLRPLKVQTWLTLRHTHFVLQPPSAENPLSDLQHLFWGHRLPPPPCFPPFHFSVPLPCADPVLSVYFPHPINTLKGLFEHYTAGETGIFRIKDLDWLSGAAPEVIRGKKRGENRWTNTKPVEMNGLAPVKVEKQN